MFLFFASRTFFQALVDEGSLSWGPTESKVACDDAKWETMYKVLLEYGEVHGDYNVPERHKVEEGSVPTPQEAQGEGAAMLGKWLQRQRHGMKTQTLRADRAAKMQRLVDSGLLVADEVAEADLSWQRHYAALTDYAQVFQHCNIPYEYEVEVEVALDPAPSTSAGGPRPSPTGVGGEHDQAAERHVDCCEGSADSKKTRRTNRMTLQLGHWLHNQRHAHNRADRLLRADRAAQLQVCVYLPDTELILN